MKFYKLELINREKSYNDMFGNQPIVGNVGNFQKPGAAVAPQNAKGVSTFPLTPSQKMSSKENGFGGVGGVGVGGMGIGGGKPPASNNSAI